MKLRLSSFVTVLLFLCFISLPSFQFRVLRTVFDGSNVTESKQQPLCSREQVQRGFWSEPNRNATMPYRSTRWEETCYHANEYYYYKSQWTVNEPCQLVTWDPVLLCHLLENQTMGFLGDSITWQIFRSMKYLLGASLTVETKQLEEFRFCSNNSTTVFWNRNNKLNANGVQKMLDRYHPDIVVANRGAWYDSDDVFFPQFNETIQQLQEWLMMNHHLPQKRNRLLIWRTTAPGIPQCEQFHAPQSNLTIMEQHVQSMSWYTGERKAFHWWEFKAQNALVETGLQRHLKEQVEFLDTYHWYIQQPDLRMGMVTTNGDCLHQCLPGVPDETNRLLLHLLQRRRIQEQSRSTFSVG